MRLIVTNQTRPNAVVVHLLSKPACNTAQLSNETVMEADPDLPRLVSNKWTSADCGMTSVRPDSLSQERKNQQMVGVEHKAGSTTGGLRTTLASVVNNKAFSNSCGLPLAAIIDFAPPEALAIQRLAWAPARCSKCHAYLNPYCTTNAGSWQCVMCNTNNPLQHPQQPEACPELSYTAVEYQRPGSESGATTFPRAVDTSQSAQPGSSASRPHVIVVLDTNIQQATLDNLQAALPLALQACLSPDTLISFIGCDSVVTLWAIASMASTSNDDNEASAPAVLQASTLSGTKAMDEVSVHRLNLDCRMYWAPLHAVSSTPDAGLSRVLAAQRCLHTHLPTMQQPRCLAVGVEAALRLAASSSKLTSNASTPGGSPPAVAYNSRIIVITGGPPIIGPMSLPQSVLEHVGGGSLPSASNQAIEQARAHAASLSSIANKLKIPIDVLSVGPCPAVSVGLMSDLAEASGGSLSHHHGTSPLLQPALQAILLRCWGTKAVLDCHLPHHLKLAQWMGPVLPITPAAKGGPAASKTACAVPSLCEGQGAVARFELTRDLSGLQAVHIQVVMHYSDAVSQTRVTRVTTLRLRVVTTIAELLQGVDPVAASVEISKRFMTDAVAAGAHRKQGALTAARTACAAAMTQLASRFGRTQVQGGVLGIGSRTWQHLPAPLIYLAQSLYTLQHSKMLSSLDSQEALHPEERLYLMKTLVNSGCSTAAAMVCPALYALVGHPGRQHSVSGSKEQHSNLSNSQLITSYPGGADDMLHTPQDSSHELRVNLDAMSTPRMRLTPFLRSHMSQQFSDALRLPPVTEEVTGGAASQPTLKLLPLPTANLMLQAAQQAVHIHAQGENTSQTTQTTPLQAVVLDIGTRLIVWPANSLLEPSSHATQQPDKVDDSGTQPKGSAQLMDLLAQAEDAPRLLGRFPTPDLLVGPPLTSSTSVLVPAPTSSAEATDSSLPESYTSLLLPVHQDTSQQQLAQLTDPLYSAAAAQSMYPDGNNTNAQHVQGALPLLHTQAVQLASNGWSPNEIINSTKQANGRAKQLYDTIRQASFREWCTELGIQLPALS